MADRAARSEVLKKLSEGKNLCSEMNNASSNANFLFMRRHDALVLQLESAKQSIVSQNQRSQNEMKKKLDKYRQRKRVIFRNRVFSTSRPSEPTEGESENIGSPRTRRRTSSIGDRSCLSGQSGTSTIRLPSILSSVSVNVDDNIHLSLNKQHRFNRMKRQENLNFQVLSAKVYEFCSSMDPGRYGGEPFFITKRRIAFTADPRARSRVSSGVALSVSRASSGNNNTRTQFREKRTGLTALTVTV